MRKVLMPVLIVMMAPLMLHGQGAQPRQVYGKWQYNEVKNYHYRTYEYKAAPADREYKKEYVIYYKADPKKQINNNWVYYYNPTTEKYWARYPTTNHPMYGKDARAGNEVWSVLPAAKRHKDLYEIDNKEWPTPPANYCPSVPMATDNIPLMSPPADLP